MADTPAPERPLHGIRVVDAATLAAGPMVATALGEFGAEVIKVEQPGVGDPLRTWGHQKDGIGLFWKSVSRNKRCVTLDLRRGEGQELFHQLLARERRRWSSTTAPAPWPGGASTTSRCTRPTRASSCST